MKQVERGLFRLIIGLCRVFHRSGLSIAAQFVVQNKENSVAFMATLFPL